MPMTGVCVFGASPHGCLHGPDAVGPELRRQRVSHGAGSMPKPPNGGEGKGDILLGRVRLVVTVR